MNESIHSQSHLEISCSIDDCLKNIITEEIKADFEGHVKGYDEENVKSIDFEDYKEKDTCYFDNDYDRMVTEYGFLVPVRNLLLIDRLCEKIENKDNVIEEKEEKKTKII